MRRIATTPNFNIRIHDADFTFQIFIIVGCHFYSHGVVRANLRRKSSTNFQAEVVVVWKFECGNSRLPTARPQCFRPAVPPTDADITIVLETISRRIIRALRKLGYLEVDTQEVVPTGYDPASDKDP
jgi:hypothetical protein